MPTQEDETTARRDLPDLADDLDEETNIIDGEDGPGTALGEAIRAAVGPATPPDVKAEPPAKKPETPASSAAPDPNFPDDPTKPRSIRAVVAAAVASIPSPVASAAAPVASAPAAPATAPPAQTAASPLITAIRVAVVVTTNLDVRVLALGANEPPPLGAAVAILVPQSDTDGAAIAKLLGVARS